jgi:hypothetical protein
VDSDVEVQMADPLLELISRLEDEIQDPDEGTLLFLTFIYQLYSSLLTFSSYD